MPLTLELFDSLQPLLKRIVYRLSYVASHKKADYMVNGCFGVRQRGMTTADVYQTGQELLLKIIRKLLSKDNAIDNIDNLAAYIGKGLYRQLKMYVEKQDDYVSLECISTHLATIENINNVDEYIDICRLRRVVSEALNDLDTRRQYIMKCLYGIDGVKPKSQAQLGRELGVSYQRIRAIHDSSLKRIKKNNKIFDKLKGMFSEVL